MILSLPELVETQFVLSRSPLKQQVLQRWKYATNIALFLARFNLHMLSLRQWLLQKRAVQIQ